MEQIKTAGDVAAATVTIGAIASWLPAVSALLTIVWVAIRIYETKTVQKWLHRGVAELTDNDD